MKTRKEELRAIMIDIISSKETVQYTPDQQVNLFIGVAEVLARRGDTPKDLRRSFVTRSHPILGESDELLAMELFWDLIIERVITPGLNKSNPLPFFRVHSEADLDSPR